MYRFIPRVQICSFIIFLASFMLAGVASAGGNLNVAVVGEPSSLDPHKLSGTWENWIVGDMFVGLTTEDQRASAIPGVAKSWKISDDGLTYTFKLRKSQWSDGKELTAHDFVYALRRLFLPETAAGYASILYIIKGAELINTGKAEVETLGVTALDDYTLEVQLHGPAAYFLQALTHYTAYPLPKHVLEKVGDKWTKPENIVVNGPYNLVEWLPNTHVKVRKNDKFYDANSVSLDTITFITQEDLVAVQKRFRAGEIDIAKDFSADQIGWLRKNLPYETLIAPWMGVYYYALNTTNDKLKDVKVRNAMAMAIDRTAITDQILKTGEIPAYSFVPPKVSHYAEPSKVAWADMPYPQALKAAKKLLKEAGYSKENPLKLVLRYNTHANHKRLAVAIAFMWKQIGVETELFNSEVKVHYADMKQGNFEVARAGWIADYNDAQNFLYLLETRTGVLNYGRYSNPEFDALMRRAEKTVDTNERADLMRRAEALAMRDLPVIPIFHYTSRSLVAKKVKGYVSNVSNINRFRYISIE